MQEYNESWALTCSGEGRLELNHVPSIVCSAISAAYSEITTGEHDAGTLNAELCEHVTDRAD
jgi:hypothetical protein